MKIYDLFIIEGKNMLDKHRAIDALIVLAWLLLSGCFMVSAAHGQTSDFESTKLAAEQGDAEAQYNLGIMYDNGQGVPEDDAEAVKWFRLAAEKGVEYAKWKLKELSYRSQSSRQYTEGVTTSPAVQVIKSATSPEEAKERAEKLKKCTPYASRAETEWAATVIMSVCFKDDSILFKSGKFKCAIEAGEAKTEIYAEQTYSQCIK